MRLFVLVLVLAIVALSGLNLFTCRALEEARRERDGLMEHYAVAQGANEALLNLHRGELKLFEIIPAGLSPVPQPSEDEFVIEPVPADAIEPFFEKYYSTYNGITRANVNNPAKIGWHIYLAVKAAKERGEWPPAEKLRD